MDEVILKKCSKCRKEKLLAEFNLGKNGKHGRQNYCRQCVAKPPRNRPTPTERFWSRVDKNGPVPEHVRHLGACWIWNGLRDKNGYGMMWMTRSGRLDRSHRLSFEFNGCQVDPDVLVCHHCDNPSCVNPGHLFLGTHADNAVDRDRKCRGNPPRGERHGFSKLTAVCVAEIRRIRSCGLTYEQIAARFRVSKSHVKRICDGTRWAHLPLQLESEGFDE